MSRITRRAAVALLSLATAGTLALGLAASAASAATHAAVKSYTSTAVTRVSDRPDSGVHGNWADDGFTRTASVTLLSEVALSYCGGTTGTGDCYHWSGQITDNGTFTTLAGATSPGNGDLNGGSAPTMGEAVTGTMSGTYSYDFYSSWKSAAKALVATTENDQGSTPGGRFTTDAWPEQFFGTGAQFFVSNTASSSLGTTGRWAYTAPLGSDPACPRLSSSWVDSSWPVANPWGAAPAQGNILAPAAADC
jgi:hypothetical protein